MRVGLVYMQKCRINMQESVIYVDKAVVFLINFSNFVASNNN